MRSWILHLLLVEISDKTVPTSVGISHLESIIMGLDVLNIIEEIGEKEQKITDLEFISPVFYNDTVMTTIDGLIYKFKIKKVNPGWYKIRPIDYKRAMIVGGADIFEREKYLKCLGKLRLTLAFKQDKVFLAVPDKNNKYQLPPNELLPVLLFDDTVLNFDRVLTRYDGVNLWFESVDMANNPMKSDYLRTSLEKFVDPKRIKYQDLTFEEKLAYTLRTGFDKIFFENKKESILKSDVEHAGGRFVRFTERSDHYSVTYRVDGEEFISHISKDNKRMVITAGICLSGNDHKFDLKSLITVVREARQRGLIYRFNNTR